MADLLDNEPVPLLEQIAEVTRELEQRDRVYPRLIRNGKLTPRRSEQQVRAMRAVLATLQDLRDRSLG